MRRIAVAVIVLKKKSLEPTTGPTLFNETAW